MRVSVVVINWNGENKLKRFLPEILKVNGVDEFIVSDDASTDQSTAYLKRNYPQIKLVSRQVNGGFAANVNSGVATARGDLIFLLNTDAVPEVDCVSKALPYFQDPKLFSIGCNTGGNWSWAKWENGFFWHYKSTKRVETHQTLWARGGSGIFRKDLFEAFGGMDELFNPFYEEDADLGYRATKRGYKNLWVKECIVKLANEKGVIEAGFSKRQYSRIAQRNQLIFTWKNITEKELISEHIKALVKLLLTKPTYWPVFLAALIKLPQILHRRSIEIKAVLLTDKQILNQFGNEVLPKKR